ncbi:transporter, partial [filamentous cyanobacterium CCP4]
SYLQVTSRVSEAIKLTLQRADIEMPTDIYTLVFRNAPPGMAQLAPSQSQEP